jgi:hypothetical protein
MLSLVHEAVSQLFRERPSLAPELLGRVLGQALPPHAEVRLESASIAETIPTEYRADLVFALSNGDADLAIVVEVQLRPDPQKRWTWPLYLASLAVRHRCPVKLLVVTLDRTTAEWASRPLELGDLVVRPGVLGPEQIPVVTDLAAARASPELTVLSALAHPEVEVARAVLEVAPALDDDRAKFYVDLVLSRLDEVGRTVLEALMLLHGKKYEYQSEFAKKWVAEGLEQGLEQGREEGRQEGRQEGLALGKAQAVLAILEARGIELGEATRTRILGCRDLFNLDRWLERAAFVTAADELT